MTASPGLEPHNLCFLRQHVYLQSGIVLETDKRYLIETRLAPILREEGLTSLDALCSVLRQSDGSPLHKRVVDAMTTNETYFFREPAHYAALREIILPELIENRRDTRKISIWSAAASTGQEAYSLAILMLEMGLEDWRIDILGTDLSERVLRQAESGRYSQIEVNRGLPAALLIRYFRRIGLEWELKETVRRMVRFQPLDLRAKMNTLGPFDVVMCRNVLIYFDLETKRKILQEINGTLFRGGRLFLGSTENAAPAGDRYLRETIGGVTVHVAR